MSDYLLGDILRADQKNSDYQFFSQTLILRILLCCTMHTHLYSRGVLGPHPLSYWLEIIDNFKIRREYY